MNQHLLRKLLILSTSASQRLFSVLACRPSYLGAGQRQRQKKAFEGGVQVKVYVRYVSGLM